jgi:hypothetical protein
MKKLLIRIVLAALAVGIFQLGAQPSFAAGGKTGDVIVVTG